MLKAVLIHLLGGSAIFFLMGVAVSMVTGNEITKAFQVTDTFDGVFLGVLFMLCTGMSYLIGQFKKVSRQ